MNHYEYLKNAVAAHMSDACLLWPFGKDKQGYGKLNFKYKDLRAHRVAYFLVHDKWPEPISLHSCDTPSCFSPFHVSAGTHAENQAEKAAKGRQIRGEMHKCSKLTPELVRQMRLDHVAGINYSALGRKYGVAEKTAREIVLRLWWKHIN